jgi:NADH-quinone oxidoreductase subunit B
VEIRREPAGPGGARSSTGADAQSVSAPNGDPTDPRALRVNKHDSRELLRGAELLGPSQPANMEVPPGGVGEELERYVHERVLTTTLEKAVAWGRSNSFFPLAFGLACCAMEQFQAAGPRLDIARFGYEAFRASPRQADLIILAGRVSIKMAPIIRRLYDQMLEPKWVISMGACASSAGMFNNYAVVQGCDKFLPVDVYVPGCPPRPEALIYGIMKLQDKIMGNPGMGWRERYQAYGTEESDQDGVGVA